MSSMAEETEKEKPKFVCKLCKLDYPTSVQFEEHLWSMLHHKAINNKSQSTTKHHCNLCMFESLDLNAYGKHLIGERHKLSLVERRKRLEDPRQGKPTAPATSCSSKSGSQTDHGTAQRITSTHWNTPAYTISNQAHFQYRVYSQSQGPNTFHQASRSNINYPHGGQFRHNQGDWQQTHSPYSWRRPNSRFEQPNMGRWENKSHVSDPKQRFPTLPQAVKQQNEKNPKRPLNPKVQGKGSKKNQGKKKAHMKKDNVTSTLNSKKATQHPVASQGLSAQGSHSQRPSYRQAHVSGEKKPSDSVKKNMQSQSVPHVRVARRPTSSKAQKKKMKKKSSPKTKPNKNKLGHAGSTPKPIKEKFAQRKNQLQNNPSVSSHQLPMKQKIKEPQIFSYLGQSSEVVSTKHSAPSKDNAASSRTFPKEYSEIDRFEMHMREALHEKCVVCCDEVVEVTSSNLASTSEKTADHSATLVTPTSSTVSSSAAVSLFQTTHKQNAKRFGEALSTTHAHSSATDTETSKIHPKRKSLASSNRESVSETGAGHIPTFRKSSFPTMSPAEPVSSFISLLRQNEKCSAELRYAPLSDKVASKIQSGMESSTRGTYLQDLRQSSSNGKMDNRSNHKDSVKNKGEETMTDKLNKVASKLYSSIDSSTTGTYIRDIGPSPSAADNSSKHKEVIENKVGETLTDESNRVASEIHSCVESSSRGSHVKDTRPSSSTKDNSSKHKEPVKNKDGDTATDESSRHESNIHSCMESSTRDIVPTCSSSTADNSSKHKELVQNKDGATITDKSYRLERPSSSAADNSSKHEEPFKNTDEENINKSSTNVPLIARSSSAPANLPRGASQNKEPSAGKGPLLSKVLVNEQQKQKLNPRPNLTNARSRLRANKDAEYPPGGHIFKETVQGLLSDVAKPVWKQKKLHMMLAKAKKAPDRFNRFSHVASSPSRTEDSINSMDIMNLSTEFQQELLDLIQSEDADEGDILSQLTAPEFSKTREANQEEFVIGNMLAESLKPWQNHAEGLVGDIQEVVPQMNQGLNERLYPSHTITSTPSITKQEPSSQEASQSLISRSPAPLVKLEPPELTGSHAFEPNLGSERFMHEGQSHPGQSSSRESLYKSNERESSERQHHTVTSATPVINQEYLTISNTDTLACQPSKLYKGQSHQGISSRKSDNRPDERKSSERHDTSVTSTSAMTPMTVIDSTEASVEIKRAHKKKKKKTKKSKSKDRHQSSVEEVRSTLTWQTSSKLKTVNRTKSPTVLTATKLKKKFKQKRKMLDTVVGDMSSLLDITLQENKLQTKMDKLTMKIDKVVEIIQEKEALLKSFKQEKEMVISSLANLREKRLTLLLGLTSGEKTDKSMSSIDKTNGSSTDDSPSSSNQSQLSCRRGTSLQSDLQPAGVSDVLREAVQSGGENDIRISDVTSMAQATPSHRTEGFRLMYESRTHPEVNQGHGTMDTFGDVGCNQARLGIDVGSPPHSHIGQSIEVVPKVMSRESLAKTLQELHSCGGGVKVDILSDEETLYGIDSVMQRESRPPSSDLIGAVAKLVNTNMSPDRDSMTQGMGFSTVCEFSGEPYQMSVDSDQVKVKQPRIYDFRAQGTLPLQSDTEAGSSILGSPYRKLTWSETLFREIKQEPQDNHYIDQGQETVMINDNELGCSSVVHMEPSSAKRKRQKEVSEGTPTKRPKHNPKGPILTNVKQALAALPETVSNAYPPECDNTLIPQTEQDHNHKSKITSAACLSGSKEKSTDNPRETSVDLKKSSESKNPQESAQKAGDASTQEKATFSPRSKGYVINMHIIVDKLYACISDSRFIIFNLTTNKIDAEEDLALGNIRHFELWRDTTASKMVAFASNGSRNLVQFDVQGKEFLQTLVLAKEITCLHVKWNSLYAGMVDGNIANVNVQKSKVSWYYTCTPHFAVTAISSTLEGGMGLLITASEDLTVTIRRADDGLLLRSLDGHRDVVTYLQVLGCRVLSMARNNTVLLHNLETGDVIRRVKHQTKMACCVMSGDTLAVAGHTGNVYYYKIETGKADIFDSGCGNITCVTASQDMLFLGIQDGFIDVIPLYPSTIYRCEWSHCISRFLRLDALKTHLQHIHIRRSARQCLWKTCLKNYPQKNTTLKVIEQHVFSHLKDLGK